MIVNVETVRVAAEALFRSAGLSDDDAALVVDESVEAELRGRHSHGVVLFSEQLDRIKDRRGDSKVVSDLGATALIDGGDNLGPPVAKMAMDLAANKAREFGVGLVGVTNKYVFVMTGYHPRRVAREGLIGLAMTVAAKRVAPFGGTTPIMGTNPLAVAFPSTDQPLVLDMAMTEIPAADIRLAKAEGRSIPEGAAIDDEGHPTTDPVAALAGAMLPFGGYKGSGLAIVVELLAGGLVHSKAGLQQGTRRGMFFMAIDPTKMEWSQPEFATVVASVQTDVRASGPDVLAPGDRAERQRARQIEEGIEVPDRVRELLGL